MYQDDLIKYEGNLINQVSNAISITNKLLSINLRPLNILHLYDHILYHEGILKCILKQFPNVNVKHIQNGDTAIEYVINCFKNKEHIDLIITDVNHMGLNGIDFSFAVRDNEKNRAKKIPILFITLMDDKSKQDKVKHLPSVIYLIKTVRCEEITLEIEKLISGSLNEINNSIISLNKDRNAKTAHDDANPNEFIMNQKEKELLTLLSKKYSAQEIIQKLGLCSRTIEALKSKWMKKFGVKNIEDLVAYAKKKSLVD